MGRNPSEDFINNYYHTNVVIRNNYVQRAGGDAIVPMYCKEPLIEYNVDSCSQNTADNPNAMYNAGIWPWRCEDAVFQYNEVFGTKLNETDRHLTVTLAVEPHTSTITAITTKADSCSYVKMNLWRASFAIISTRMTREHCLCFPIQNEAVFYNNTFYIDGANMILDTAERQVCTIIFSTMLEKISLFPGVEKIQPITQTCTMDLTIFQTMQTKWKEIQNL